MSGRAVLLVDADTAPERYRQIASICGRLALDVEHVLLQGASLPDDPDRPVDRFGVMPPEATDDASASAAFLAAFTAREGCRLLYGSGTHGARLVGAFGGPVRIVEAATVGSEGSPPDVLALEQTPRGAAASSRPASHTAFLPPPLPRFPRPSLGRAAYVGWVGCWNDDLCSAWHELACALRDRRAVLPDGVLLAGEGVGSLRLPPELAPVVGTSEGGRLAAARRALGLAVLPIGDPEPYAADLSRLLGAGVPVLTLADCAARFKEAWSLPVAGDIKELATRIAEASLPSMALQDDADATRRAFETRLRHAEDALTAQLQRQLGRRAANRR